MKVTQWFQAPLQPKREGLYQRRHVKGLVTYSYWKNGVWHMSSFQAESALHYGTENVKVSDFQHLQWRGIAK